MYYATDQRYSGYFLPGVMGSNLKSSGSDFKKDSKIWRGDNHKKIPNNYREIPLPFNRSRLYELKSSKSAGDGTVPVESFKAIQHQNGLSIKSILATDVERQEAYKVKDLFDIHQRPALKFTLRAIAKIVQEVPVCG